MNKAGRALPDFGKVSDWVRGGEKSGTFLMRNCQ